MIELQKNSLQLGDSALDVLSDAIAEANVNVALGANELDDRPGSETLYNSIFYFDRDGDHVGTHRKLVPTHVERTIWGRGDPGSLDTYDLDVGTVGGLICYENHMTLSKAALAAKGEEIHVAPWTGFWQQDPETPGVKLEATSEDALETSDIYPAMREYAFETQSYVVSSSPYVPDDVLAEYLGYKPDLSVGTGGSMLIDPLGVVQAGPVFGEEQLLTHEFDRDDRRAAKTIFDALGHYTRWDAVQLSIDDADLGPVVPRAEHDGSTVLPDGDRLRALAEKHDVSETVVRDLVEDLRTEEF
jgi:amidase/nitrilase